MTSAIAIIGMGCQYPDARSPLELWENVLAQRQAFRQIPPERLRVADYLSADRQAADCTYSAEAALIEGYEFDRVRFRVAGPTFRSADLAHWLALDVAAQALADAGFPEGSDLPHETTGVLLGNTLTGEFSRANTLRLRWPYVRRVVEAVLVEDGWSREQRSSFLHALEANYKTPFPPVGEETLAGGLSNTIAGRICNHFDLKGGGYTVDGACSSSLLAVATGCSALAAGDLDVAIVGGVDVSLDPFELVGFAKTGALAPEKMRVYDLRSAGFWPGEGCGFVILMRQDDAVALRRRIYAVIRGWGISSDGSGGITRPEVEGQLLAVRRAYRRAGFGVETVAYFEGHGTGTSVGDATEIRVLARARREAQPDAAPASIGTIKANIGHTKAAAGVAGLIKATLALHTQILPPTTGCEQPHPELLDGQPALQVLRQGLPWPAELALRAGVSSMGFGGINTHVVLEGVAGSRRRGFTPYEHTLLSSAQDAELFLLEANDRTELQRQVEHLCALAPKLSRAELADLAAHLARMLGGQPMRAAVVASSPAELARCLTTLRTWLANESATQVDVQAGVFLGTRTMAPQIGFLFPGQGSPAHLSGGALRERFPCVQALYQRAHLPRSADTQATAVAQPAIVTASLAALHVLDQLGIAATVAVGHSLGELTALHWAGILDEEALLRVAATRGKVMADLGDPTGVMASIGVGPATVESLLNGDPVVIAGLNSPHQTVIAGTATAVESVVARARAQRIPAIRLPVSHAFHSPLVAAAAPGLVEHLAREDIRPPERTVVSTVTGTALKPNEDVRMLLARQVTSPVRFMEAVTAAGAGLDLLIEAGPGQVLSNLASTFLDIPVVALDAGGPSLKGLLKAVGASFALGAPVQHQELFVGRFTRPFDLNWHPRFFANPCELAPVPEEYEPPHAGLQTQGDGRHSHALESAAQSEQMPEDGAEAVDTPLLLEASATSPMELIRQLVAERTELPPSAVQNDDHLLDNLHLNSITVSQIVTEAARRLGLPRPSAPTDYADATVADVAKALEELSRIGCSTDIDTDVPAPPGVDTWIRTFVVELVERPMPRRQLASRAGNWHVIAPPEHPLAGSLREAFTHAGRGAGVVVCLPPEPDEQYVDLLLEGARAVLAEQQAQRFVLVQHSEVGAAFARTLSLEVPEVTTCVVDVPPDHPQATEWVVAEAMAAVGHTEAYYDHSGHRREPVLRLLTGADERAELPLGPHDVLLVTGGGKGITAECALSLAQETGARLALLGRSQPAEDAELAANLERIAAAGLQFSYLIADVTDMEAVRAAVREVEINLGPVTGILHGAARNVPQLLHSLDRTAFLSTLEPKVQGMRNVLAAVNQDQLRLLITFGSIIGRAGLRGEADYALANEWLVRLTERFQEEHPTCRCLAVEWSIWSSVGMGARLGSIDALLQAGITPIPPDEGIALLRRLLAQRLPAVAVVVTGRYGELPTLKVDQPELPFSRFLERPRVYYPGVELVVEAELSVATDPYLDDHVFHGERLLPAVLGIEAMAQTAMAVVGSSDLPVFEDVAFSRPVVVPSDEAVTIRMAALVREDHVEVVLRSQETAFQVDHFRAICRFGMQPMAGSAERANAPGYPQGDSAAPSDLPYVPIDPDHDLYGGLLFHTGRFQRLRGYRRLAATECIAEISSSTSADWFGPYLPPALMLGDPGKRDAAIHAIQVCVPNAALLPIGCERLMLTSGSASEHWLVHARERWHEGDTFSYDVDITDADGCVQERWEGLQLRSVSGTTFHGVWVAPLLGPYIERQVRDLIRSTSVAVVVDRDARGDRHTRSNRAIQRVLGTAAPVLRRADGKPEVVGAQSVSAAHAGALTLAVAGPEPVACDIEPVEERPASVWQELLGHERWALAQAIRHEMGEDEAAVATRVWTVSECLTKVGAMVQAPVVLIATRADGWVLLASGKFIIATFVAPVRGFEERLALAVLVRSNDARL